MFKLKPELAFPPKWFRSLHDGSRLGQLRWLWIQHNLAQDDQTSWEERQQWLEASASWLNPEFYFKVKEQEKSKAVTIVRTDTFKEKVARAELGEEFQQSQNEHILAAMERWKQVKEAQSQDMMGRDPRIKTHVTSDELKVTRKRPGKL